MQSFRSEKYGTLSAAAFMHDALRQLEPDKVSRSTQQDSSFTNAAPVSRLRCQVDSGKLSGWNQLQDDARSRIIVVIVGPASS